MPIFGLVPYVAKEERREFAALDTPRGQIAEAFRALRISLSLSEASRKAHLLAITSSVTNEGKSFISLNIAFAQAQAGKKVLFVDADMHKHSSTNLLMPQADSQRAGGLSNLLAEALPLNEYASLVTRPVANLSLDFLASGLMPPNPAELLGSSLTAKLCALMLEEYDLVIFDAPPVLNVTDVRTLAAIPEMNFLLVVRMLATEKRQIRSTMEVLQTVGAKVVGSIMNNATAQTESTYGYGYGYAYGYDDTPTAEPQSGWKKILKYLPIKRV
jgi:capsular exopolysaccharide synthesis family protein